MTERERQRKCLGSKTRKAADEKRLKQKRKKKGKGVLCQEKCANLLQLKQIFKETLQDFVSLTLSDLILEEYLI